MWDYNIGMGSRDKNAVQPHKVRHLMLQRFKVKLSCNESESIFMQCREKHASMRRFQWTAQSETGSRFLSVWVRLGWSLCCVTTRNSEFLPHVTHIENLLNNPAVVSLQCLLIGFGDINPNEVGVVLISVPVCQTLEQDLDETETPAGETEYIKAFILLD